MRPVHQLQVFMCVDRTCAPSSSTASFCVCFVYKKPALELSPPTVVLMIKDQVINVLDFEGHVVSLCNVSVMYVVSFE